MKRKIYLETPVISYLTAHPSKTIIGAAHQQITQAWWAQRFEYELFVSQSAWQECSAGSPDAAQKRLAVLESLAVLAITEEVIELAESLILQKLIQAKAVEDAIHIALTQLSKKALPNTLIHWVIFAGYLYAGRIVRGAK